MRGERDPWLRLLAAPRPPHRRALLGYNRLTTPTVKTAHALLRIRVPGLQVLRRSDAEDYRCAAHALPILRQARPEEARLGAGIPPEGRRLVRDRLQIGQGDPAQSPRGREGRVEGREQAGSHGSEASGGGSQG